MIKKIRLSTLAFFVMIFFCISEASALSSAGLRVTFSDTVKKTSPAVVNIFAEKMVTERMRHPFFDDPFFNHFYDGAIPGGLKRKIERSLGSGVIVTDDGYLVSNYHVVKAAESAKVVFQDGSEMEAEVIAVDEKVDVAILKLNVSEDKKLPFLNFGDSDTIEVGDVVLSLGNPFGVGQSVSMGIVSATGRNNLGSGGYENFIQTDAAINPGSSGGALVDSSGALIGINTAIYSRTGGSQGIGFAIPANTVRVLLNSVLATGKITRPFLGASGQDVTTELAESLGLEKAQGMLVNEIYPDSPAEKANLFISDIILAFDGQPVTGSKDLDLRVYGSFVGEKYPLSVWREGKEYTTEVILGALPDRLIDKQYTPMGSHPMSGFTFEPLGAALNDELGFSLNRKGIAVVKTPAESRFGLAQLQLGDLIVSVNNTSINTMRDLQRALSRRPKVWNIVARRGGGTVKFRVQ